MVERNGCEDRHLAVRDIRGVPLAAHPDFEHHHVDRRIREGGKREQGEGLKETERVLAVELQLGIGDVEEGPDVVPVRHEGGVTDGLAVDHDALVDPLKVRTREHPRA